MVIRFFSLYYDDINSNNNKLGWFPSTHITPIVLNVASYSIATNYKQQKEEEKKTNVQNMFNYTTTTTTTKKRNKNYEFIINIII